MSQQSITYSVAKEQEFREVIRPLYLLMQLSIKAYKKYMQNKIYLHALVIRSANRKVYDHLVTNLSRVPESLEVDVLELLNHYDIWMEQFKEFETNNKPAVSDPFIFYHIDQLSAFPSEAEQNIFDYYHFLKNSIKQATDE